MHKSTREQGVDDFEGSQLSTLKSFLLFEEIPTKEEILQKAQEIAFMAEGYSAAMIGGAPYLMAPLQEALKKKGIKTLFSFSKRVSEEIQTPNGEVKKVITFKHLGFVPGV